MAKEIYNAAARARIDRVVIHAENAGDPLPTPVPQANTESRLVWFELADDIDENGRASAYRLNWSASDNDGDGDVSQEDTADYTVYCPPGTFAASEGDRVICRELGTINGNLWEVIAAGLPSGDTTNDILRWVQDSGTPRWVIHPAPLPEGDHFLMIRDGLMEWVEGEEFECFPSGSGSGS